MLISEDLVSNHLGRQLSPFYSLFKKSGNWGINEIDNHCGLRGNVLLEEDLLENKAITSLGVCVGVCVEIEISCIYL